MNSFSKTTLQVALLSLVCGILFLGIVFIETGGDLGGMIAEQMVSAAIISLLTFYLLTTSWLVFRAKQVTKTGQQISHSSALLAVVLIAVISMAIGLLSPVILG